MEGWNLFIKLQGRNSDTVEGKEKQAVLALPRLHGLRGERKALWRDSDTVPEAEERAKRVDNEGISKKK